MGTDGLLISVKQRGSDILNIINNHGHELYHFYALLWSDWRWTHSGYCFKFKTYADTENMKKRTGMKFRRQENLKIQSFSTYLATVKKRKWETSNRSRSTRRIAREKLYFQHFNKTISKFIKDRTPTYSCSSCRHEFLFKDAVIDGPALNKAIKKVFDARNSRVSSGRPHFKKKLSINHLKERINCEIQADVHTCCAKESNYKIPVIIDLGSTYGEICITP